MKQMRIPGSGGAEQLIGYKDAKCPNRIQGNNSESDCNNNTFIALGNPHIVRYKLKGGNQGAVYFQPIEGAIVLMCCKCEKKWVAEELLKENATQIVAKK